MHRLCLVVLLRFLFATKLEYLNTYFLVFLFHVIGSVYCRLSSLPGLNSAEERHVSTAQFIFMPFRYIYRCLVYRVDLILKGDTQ